MTLGKICWIVVRSRAKCPEPETGAEGMVAEICNVERPEHRAGAVGQQRKM